MTKKYEPRKITGLFGVILVCFFLVFLLGVWVGKGFSSGPLELKRAATDEPDSTLDRSQLGFYQDLVQRDRPQIPEAEEDVSMDTNAENQPQTTLPPSSADFDPSVSEPSQVIPTDRPFTVQVSAVESRDEARQVLLRLQAKGYAPDFIEPGDENGFYRLWVGEFPSKEAAREMENRLKVDQFPTYIRQKH
jgi:cell division septation protein DedD